MRRLILRRRSGSSGQTLPLLALLMSFIFIAAIALSQFMLRAHRQFVSDEKDFQRAFVQELRTAFLLNAICENNRRITETLAHLVADFRSGSAYLLDVAASTPVWENEIPIPLAEEAFASFHTSAALARQKLMQLKKSNNALVQSVPDSVRSQLQTLSTREAICAIARGHFKGSNQIATLTDCSVTANGSLLAQSHFRSLRDLSLLIDSVGPQAGLVHISITTDVILRHPKQMPQDRTWPNPFSRKKIILTHARDCPSKTKPMLKGLCPPLSIHADHRTKLVQNEGGSFDARWSIFVESENNPL